MRNFKRFLSLALALLMIFSYAPTIAYATESDNTVFIADDGEVPGEGEDQILSTASVGEPTSGADTDFTDATANESGLGWTWDFETKVLTLSGAAINEAVVLPAGSTIVVTEGTENSVTVKDIDAIYSTGALAIKGTGKLTVKVEFEQGNGSAVVAPNVSITETEVDFYGFYYGIQAKTTSGEIDSVVTLTNVSGKIAGYGYGGINAHSETANVTVTLTGCYDLEMYNEVTNDSTSVNFNFAGIRAYTRGNGKDVLVELNGCDNVSISNSTMAILAANNANAANEAAADVKVLIKDSTNIDLSAKTSCYSAVFVNNYGIENDDGASLVVENSTLEINAPNATALMTSTKSAPSEVDVIDSKVTITAGLTGIRTIASAAEYADTDVTGSTLTFTQKPSANYVDESVGSGVVKDTEYSDSTSTIIRPNTIREVSTKAELDAAIAAADDGDTIKLTASFDYGTDHLKIEKEITLDFGGNTLTTRARNYGLALYSNCTVTNGKLNHAGTVAAIKVWDAKEISNLEIDVTGTSSSGNAIGGIVIQENADGVDVIKNVKIHSTDGQGVANGIETYNCGNKQVIGSMENVTIDAVGNGMLLSAPCGTATNCSIKGGVSGIDMFLKSTYSVSLELVNCDVEGGEQAVYAHDEQKGYTYVGTISLTADDETTFVSEDGDLLNINIEKTTIATLPEKLYDGFDVKVGNKYFKTLKEAIKACTNGETVTLLNNITYEADDVVYAHGGATGFGNYDHYNPCILYIGGTKGATPAENQPSNVNAVLDLNGHTITNNADAYGLIIMDNAKLTIEDNVGGGKIVGNNANYPVLWVVGTDTLVTVDGGLYQTNSPYGVVHVTHGGDLVISGGEFKTTATDASLLIMTNSQKFNNPNYFLVGVATVTINGGTFYGFNPAKVGDDYGASSLDEIKFVNGCGDGFIPVENEDGTYGVKAWYDENATTLYINNIYELLAFAETANAGKTFSGKTVKLMADINLDGMTWTPISKFAGKFDGNDHTISNFYIDGTAAHSGFFNVLEWATVEKLTLSNITATVGNYRFGTLARSINQTNIENVKVTDVTVTTTAPEAFVAGLFASGTVNSNMEVNNCTVENLTVNAEAGADFIAGITTVVQKNGTEAEGTNIFENLTVKNFKVIVTDTDGTCRVGGLVGQTQSVWQNPHFKNCSVTGLDVTSTDKVDVGGFICCPGSWTYAEGCSTEGKIDVTGVTSSTNYAGGFLGNYGWGDNVGKGDHKVTNCSADVDIITNVATVGGFVGSGTNIENKNKNITLTNCEAKGDITCVEGGTANIGGFFGDADRGTYINCTASGTITNNGTGFAGVFGGARLKNVLKIDNCTYSGTSKLNFIGNAIYVAQIGTDGDKFETLKDAFAAAQPGDTINLLHNASTDIAVVIDKLVVLNLNEFNVSATKEDTVGDGVFHVISGGDLTINGEGTINGVGGSEWAMAIWADGGKVTINGGYYTNVGATGSNTSQYDLIYAKNGGEVVINGGKFESQTPNYTLNTNKNAPGTILVKGGTFVGVNPANNIADGLNTNYVADGYGAVDNGDNTWTVVLMTAAIYSSEGEYIKGYFELYEALADAKAEETVKLLKDASGSDIYVKSGRTLDLNGFTLTADYVVVFNGANLVDNSDDNTGRLVVNEDFMISNVNAQLPVKTTDGYAFVEITDFPTANSKNHNVSFDFAFVPKFEANAIEMLKEGFETTGVQIVVRVSWTMDVITKDADGNDITTTITRSQNFVYSDALVDYVLNNYEDGSYKKMFTLNFTNEPSSISYDAFVISDTGVEFIGKPIPATK